MKWVPGRLFILTRFSSSLVANRDVLAAALEANLDKPVFASKNPIKVYNRIKIATGRREEHVVRNILAVHSATSPSRLLVHVALHACIRSSERALATEIFSAVYFRVRSKTFEAILRLFLRSRAQEPLWTRPQLTEANHVDNPVDSSIVAWHPLRGGLEFFLLAKERRQRRTQASYEALVQALLNRKEYETAARLFALVTHDHHIIRTRHLREDSADLDYLAAENLEPSHIILSKICTAVKKQLHILRNASSRKGVVDSCTRAVGCLSSLLYNRQLPFQDISKFLELMFAFTTHDHQCALWIPSTTGLKLEQAQNYVRSVILDLIENPPSERVPKSIADIGKPLMPPLTWRSYCLLLAGVKNTWEDEALTEVILRSMVQRFLGPQKTMEDLKMLFDIPRRRREGGRNKSLAADYPSEAKTHEKSQGEVESGSRAITFDELYSWLEAEERDQDRSAEAVQWTLDEWALKDRIATRNAGLRKDEFPDNPIVKKGNSPTFRELVEAWHGDKTEPKGRSK